MFLSVTFMATTALAGSPWAGTDVVSRAADIVKKMTLDEKLSMTFGRNAKSDFPVPLYFVGNVPGTPRLGLPPLSLEDGPQGVADGLVNVTQWPSQLTASQAWSTDLMERWGAAMGLEQRRKGTNVMLGPDVNLARVPWSGRVFETMGEDPLLASALVAPLIRGIQSNNLSACVKHFVGNNQECNRQTMSANMDERTAREMYLPAFFAAVDAGVGSVMCAFNRVNDTFACENEGALGRWLKDAGGFRGWVVTDWGAQHNSIAAAVAGLDQEMEWDMDANKTRYGGIGFANPAFKEAVVNGTVPESRLDDMATRMVEPMLALGLVAHPADPSAANTTSVASSAEHAALAAEIAGESIVMLKNDGGALPVKPGAKIAVFGNPYYRAGKGSGGVQYPYAPGATNRAVRCDPPVCDPNTAYLPQVLVNAGHAVTVGSDGAQAGTGDKKFNVTRAAAEAAAADVAVVVVYGVTGEGMDRPNMSLDAWQDLMVRTVAAANKNTVVVARVSGAFDMPWLGDVRAVLYQLMPGAAAGKAAGDVITGARNPGGKLTVSFPASMNATWLGSPALNPRRYSCAANADVDYSEKLEVGYRWFAAHPTEPPPVFPFGHGLGFSPFEYSGLSASASGCSFTVANAGGVGGVEIAQLYLGFPDGSGEPPRVLAGFDRVRLDVGASAKVTVPLTERSVSVWGGSAWVKVPGTYHVYVGASSSDMRLSGTFTV